MPIVDPLMRNRHATGDDGSAPNGHAPENGVQAIGKETDQGPGPGRQIQPAARAQGQDVAGSGVLDHGLGVGPGIPAQMHPAMAVPAGTGVEPFAPARDLAGPSDVLVLV